MIGSVGPERRQGHVAGVDLRFVPVEDRKQARIVITIKHSPGGGHYHGYGDAGPPARENDGQLRQSVVNLGFHGEVDQAEYGSWDHWAQGGDPPRLERPAPARPFEMSVDVQADYIAPATFAGIFLLLNARDWVYFGPFEHPRKIAAQRTGQDKSPLLTTDSNKYQLRAAYANGRLRLTCICGGREHVVQWLNGLPPPQRVAVGMKCRGPPEIGYRHLQFRDLTLSDTPLPRKTRSALGPGTTPFTALSVRLY